MRSIGIIEKLTIRGKNRVHVVSRRSTIENFEKGRKKTGLISAHSLVKGADSQEPVKVDPGHLDIAQFRVSHPHSGVTLGWLLDVAGSELRP